MPTSAAGNKLLTPPARSVLPVGRTQRPASALARGFTLIELMVVVAIIAIASAGVMFAVRDSAGSRLEREALRLAALLESARAQARASGQVVRWRAVEGGFRFEGLPGTTLPYRWQGDDIQVRGTRQLVLGPEPLLPPQAVVIESAALPGRPLQVATDGVRPFRVGPVTGMP